MGRLLVLLPLCLFLQDQRRSWDAAPMEEESQRLTVPSEPLAGPALMRQEVLAGLGAFPAMPFPANLPWCPLEKAATRRHQALEKILREQPIDFLKMCLDRYDREVKGYRCKMYKQERIGTQLQPREVIDIQFREQPFSVLMTWKEGARKAKQVLYVEGQNKGEMLARPNTGFKWIDGMIVSRSVNGSDARQSGRYPVSEFGMKIGSLRTYQSWLSAQGRKVLHLNYKGIYQVKEVGNRTCYKLVRSPYEYPEQDGLNNDSVAELTIYLDTETWLQTGSILKGADGKILAQYFFSDIQLNPDFNPDPFTRKTLEK